jgi:hypothetical protein
MLNPLSGAAVQVSALEKGKHAVGAVYEAVNELANRKIAIEEMLVLTPEGAKIISLYPAKELPVANNY